MKKLRLINDVTYSNKSKQILIKELTCDDCKTKYIILKKGYNGGKLVTVESTIDNEDTECLVCNNHKYDMIDLNKDIDELSRIIKATEVNSNNTKIRCRQYRNNQITPIWNIIYEIGKNQVNRFGNSDFVVAKYAIQCNRCKHIKLTETDSLTDIQNIVCNKCRYLLSYKLNQRYMNIVKELKPEIEEVKRQAEKEEILSNNDNEIEDIEKKKADAFAHLKKRFSKHNPNIKMLAAYRVGDMDTTLLCCDLCGTPKEVSSHALKDLKEYQCLGCKEQEKNPNYLGLYKRDILNTTKNGLICIRQDGDKVTLRCNYCRTIYKDRDKIKFLLGKIGCTKKDICSSVNVLCPECYYSIDLKNKDVFNSKPTELTCTKCNKNIYTDALNEIILEDKRIELREGLRFLSNQTKKPVEFQNGIARSYQALYRGRDGLNYYNCRCTIHNQSCILNEGEIETDSHKYCNNSRNIYILDDISKLILYREKRNE